MIIRVKFFKQQSRQLRANFSSYERVHNRDIILQIALVFVNNFFPYYIIKLRFLHSYFTRVYDVNEIKSLHVVN